MLFAGFVFYLVEQIFFTDFYPPKKNLLITFNLNVSLFMFEEVGLPINLLKFNSYIAYFELKCRCLLSVNQTKPTPIIVLMTNRPQPSFPSPCLQDSN